jgi:hypothetical protein
VPGRIADDDLLADLRRVADDLGRAPKTAEYDERGAYAYRTVRDRFGTWADALREAGLDPESRDANRGLPVTCPRCDAGHRYAGDRDRYECPDCGARTSVWHGRVRRLCGHRVVRRLAAGPKTTTELGTGVNQTVAPFVERLKPPRGGPADGTDPETVVYLYGDDRAAARRFVEVNADYVAAALAADRNPLRAAWDDERYRLLVQQWEWRAAP